MTSSSGHYHDLDVSSCGALVWSTYCSTFTLRLVQRKTNFRPTSGPFHNSFSEKPNQKLVCTGVNRNLKNLKTIKFELNLKVTEKSIFVCHPVDNESKGTKDLRFFIFSSLGKKFFEMNFNLFNSNHVIYLPHNCFVMIYTV